MALEQGTRSKRKTPTSPYSRQPHVAVCKASTLPAGALECATLAQARNDCLLRRLEGLARAMTDALRIPADTFYRHADRLISLWTKVAAPRFFRALLLLASPVCL